MKHDELVNAIFQWMQLKDKLKRSMIKSNIHQRGISKQVFWTIVTRILRGRYDNLLEVDSDAYIFPFIDDGELIDF